MLGDQEEEKKAGNPLNPLKKAIRRRNVKTVQFTAPTYVEPSDVEYDSEEEEDEGSGSFSNQRPEGAEVQSRQEQASQVDDTATVAPLNTRDRVSNGRPIDGMVSAEPNNLDRDQSDIAERPRTSDEIFERTNTSYQRREKVLANYCR